MLKSLGLLTQLDRVDSGRILNTDGNQPTHSSLIHRRSNPKSAFEPTKCQRVKQPKNEKNEKSKFKGLTRPVS